MSPNLDIKGRNYKWVIYLTDVVILVSVFVVFVNCIVEPMGWRNYDGDSRFYWNRFGHMFVFLLSYVVAISTVKITPKDLDSMLMTFIRSGLQIGIMYLFFTLSVAILFRTFPGHLLMWSGIVNGILMTSAHCLITYVVVRRRKRHMVNIVFVGADANNIRLYDKIKNGYSTFTYNILGFFSTIHKDSIPANSDYLGGISEVVPYLENNGVDMVLCSLNPAKSVVEISGIVDTCESRFISFYYVPNMEGYPERQMHFNQWGDVAVLGLRNEPLTDFYNRAVKRLFDVTVSGLCLVTIFPLVLIIVTVGTTLTSPGPIFFRQRRTGYNGKSFTMYKFRSMRQNSEADTRQATKGDPRITAFGRLLRRSSLDELPQLINVFRGEMSIVGPRPHMDAQTEQYSKLIKSYLVRHLCKPGLTGWAQVNGCRGETRTLEEMAERVRHDIWYIENWSMLLDVRIILKTALQIFKGDGQAY